MTNVEKETAGLQNGSIQDIWMLTDRESIWWLSGYRLTDWTLIICLVPNPVRIAVSFIHNSKCAILQSEPLKSIWSVQMFQLASNQSTGLEKTAMTLSLFSNPAEELTSERPHKMYTAPKHAVSVSFTEAVDSPLKAYHRKHAFQTNVWKFNSSPTQTLLQYSHDITACFRLNLTPLAGRSICFRVFFWWFNCADSFPSCLALMSATQWRYTEASVLLRSPWQQPHCNSVGCHGSGHPRLFPDWALFICLAQMDAHISAACLSHQSQRHTDPCH